MRVTLGAPAASAASPEAVFRAYRSLFHGWMYFAFAVALLGLAVGVLAAGIGDGEASAPAAIFTAVIAIYWYTAMTQLKDRHPQIVVDAQGLYLAGVSLVPIPWSRIRHASAIRGPLGGRLDVAVDPGSFTDLKLGQSFLGDPVVKRRGLANGFSISTQGYDRGAAEILAAMQRYWPPTEASAASNEA
ncbi:MAG: hypothetical protein ACT4P2_05035 [Pseudomonadota bacterium]